MKTDEQAMKKAKTKRKENARYIHIIFIMSVYESLTSTFLTHQTKQEGTTKS